MRKRDVETLARIVASMRPPSNTNLALARWEDGRSRIMNEVIPSNRVTLFLNLCPKEPLNPAGRPR